MGTEGALWALFFPPRMDPMGMTWGAGSDKIKSLTAQRAFGPETLPTK